MLDENTDIFSMRVRPAPSPLKKANDIAHFYTHAATSTFVITRKGNLVKAEEIGRNEIPNTKTHSLLDNLRNGVVAFTASHGMAYPQWKALLSGLIKANDHN